MKKILILLLIAICGILNADVNVTVIGQAAGSGKIARQQALADALRKAVRKGAGVNIISSSQTTDYVLDFDRIFSRAFGYVKSFEILDSGYDNAGLLNIKISALVGKAIPNMDDYLAMRQIIAMKSSPRLLIRTKGRITDIGDAQKLIAGQLREIALNCGFNTIKIEQFKEAQGKRKTRDLMKGKPVSATYRNAGVRNNYDIVIDADISGSFNGKTELYGIPTNRFSFGADLGASYPNGKAIAQITIPSREIDIAQVSEKSQAARAALQKILAGQKGKNFRALLMRIIAAWISEFDTGANITVEFDNISQDLFDQVILKLKKASGVNKVNVREFDSKLKSIIDVDTNLESRNIANLLYVLSDGKYEATHFTNDYVQMVAIATYSSYELLVVGIAALVIIFLLYMIGKTLKSARSSKPAK